MSHVEELRSENRALRDRFARLSGTVLRIGSSLDLATVPTGDRRQRTRVHRRA